MKKRRGNYKFLERFSWYVPGVGGMFMLLLWLLLGAVAGSIVTLILGAVAGKEAISVYGNLLSYPIMFIPPMIYAGLKSSSQAMDNKGYKLDSNNFSPLGAGLCILLVTVCTLATGFWVDCLTSLLPEMPDFLKEALQGLTSGNFLVNFLCVSIMAPLCEEWLCRGLILRGLLKTTKLRPAVAIIISAVFFAVIHMNPWQAIPAFIIGCIFGYVYYKTGSLKLTMLMHFVNNTFALICGHIDALKDMESWLDVMPVQTFTIIAAACFLLTCLTVLAFRRIPVRAQGGNIDEIPSLFDSYED